MYKKLLILVAIFIASQLANDAYTRRTGPFAYFQEHNGTRDFMAINAIIDEHFLTPRTPDETLSYLRGAQFWCSELRKTEEDLLKVNSDIKLKMEKSSGLGCHYDFGGWLPYPKRWLIMVQFGEDGLTNSILPQREAN